MKKELFKDYSMRLNMLDENIRKLAVKYAEKYYTINQFSREEALERSFVKAEMEMRNLNK